MENETCSKPPTSYKHMEIDGNSGKQKLLRPVWLILPPPLHHASSPIFAGNPPVLSHSLWFQTLL